MDPDTQSNRPPIFNYVLSFLLVGLAWGFTTPFIRRAAQDFNAAQERSQAQAREQEQEQEHKSSTETSGKTDRSEYEGREEEHQLLLAAYDGEDKEEDNATTPGPAPSSAKKPGIPTTTTTTTTISWIKDRIISVFWTIVNLLRTPAYSVPLLLNLSGSVWFFLLVGKHGNHIYLVIALSNLFRILLLTGCMLL